MQSYTATKSPKILPVARFRLATFLAWTLLGVITAVWECNDNLAFVASSAQVARANSGAGTGTPREGIERMVRSNLTHVVIIAAIWLTGLAGLRFGFCRIRAVTAALKAERDNLDSVFDATPIPMLLFDDRMEAVRGNAAFRDHCVDYDRLPDRRCGTVLGCARALSKPAGCGNTPACLSCAIRRVLREKLESAFPIHGETSFLRAVDGATTEITLLYSADSVSLDGRSHALMSFMDITERKLIEKKQVAREHEFRSLAETLPDCPL